MSKPKITIIFTGGTIAMKASKQKGGAVPALKGKDLLRQVPEIAGIAAVTVHDFGQYPGPHMTPKLMLELSQLVKKYLSQKDTDGVIVTHGTDTLEETAFFLDLCLNSQKPVVVVGAMKDCTELGWDGPSNLMGAVRTALSPQSRGKGVLVFLNNTINSAGEVTKTSTDSFETFRSPYLVPLGGLDQDRLLFYSWGASWQLSWLSCRWCHYTTGYPMLTQKHLRRAASFLQDSYSRPALTVSFALFYHCSRRHP